MSLSPASYLTPMGKLWEISQQLWYLAAFQGQPTKTGDQGLPLWGQCWAQAYKGGWEEAWLECQVGGLGLWREMPCHDVAITWCELRAASLKGGLTAHSDPAPSRTPTSGSATAPGRAGWSSTSMPTPNQVFEAGGRAPGSTQRKPWRDYSLPHATVHSSLYISLLESTSSPK